ncbi:MAG: glycosyltransferase family 4 protein [Thermoanaerobaculales bacterium]|jgi:glycosyltransferase involved in cell wall biosynthesis|nr:glycosyltransferase family 4 protein [Thermoanaerobaculales bacterium]
MRLAELPHRLAAAVRRFTGARAYRRSLARGEPAGTLGYVFTPWPAPDPPLVELRLRADGETAVARAEAAEWRRRQTLAELRVVGMTGDGREAWRIEADRVEPDTAAAWFAAPGGLPEVVAAHLESCLLVSAAEVVDAVVLRERVEPPLATAIGDAEPAHGEGLRPWALYRCDAYRWEPSSDTVRPTRAGRLVKLVDTTGVADLPRDATVWGRSRRGPYLADHDLGPDARVALRDAALLGRRPAAEPRPAVLVTVPFLARGGAEQTLHATMAALARRFRFSIATLAPHRAALGDRRPDFLEITDRIVCLGDLVHPDAMLGMLLALLDAEGARILYNANGTTLFYDFAARLKAARPGLRIVDHLYDHRIGYIDRYTPGLEAAVDACVAENRPIAEVLVEERGWPADRVPVIWPCGRPEEALPPEAGRDRLRASLRHELGFTDRDVVLLTAARLHPQKRPLDLVALAGRVRDLEEIHLLLVGGGDLEAEVDAAIAAGGGLRIRRLGFRRDIPDLIVAADVGCLVSEHEGLPVFMLECLQLGRPFLGTRVGDLGAVLDETGAGLVVDRPGDLEALEAAVRRLADPATRAVLAERALAAAPRFSVAACADATARVLLGGP